MPTVNIKDENLFKLFKLTVNALGLKVIDALEDAVADWIKKKAPQLRKLGFTITLKK